MTKHYTDEGTLLIRNSDIKDGKFEFGDNPIYLEKTFAEKNETRMHQIGDVITVHTGDVGTSAVITENEAKSIGFATIVTRPNPKIIDSNYLCSFLNTDKHKKWAVSISTGDGRTNYNLGDYFELVVPVPSIAEQKKIASYIQKLNRLITLHQREFAFLCKEKSKKFRYIKNAWEQRKLGELFNFHYGDGNNNPSNGGKYPVFGAGGIQGGYTKYNAENSVIIGHMGDAGCVSWGEGKHFVTYNGTITKPKDEVFSAKFGYYLLLHMNLRKYRGGSGLPFLTYDMLTEMETKCTNSKVETQKIADYFTHLDHLITLHQRKPNFYTGGYYAE